MSSLSPVFGGRLDLLSFDNGWTNYFNLFESSILRYSFSLGIFRKCCWLENGFRSIVIFWHSAGNHQAFAVMHFFLILLLGSLYLFRLCSMCFRSLIHQGHFFRLWFLLLSMNPMRFSSNSITTGLWPDLTSASHNLAITFCLFKNMKN